jgi:CheY-like chemotaxis protein
MNVLRTDVPRRRVLVIEDDPIIQRVLEKVLSREGYAVTTTDSAIGAMDLARRLRPVVFWWTSPCPSGRAPGCWPN